MSVQSFHDLLHSMVSKRARVLYLCEGATPRIRSEASLTPLSDLPWSAAQADELLGSILPAQHSSQYQTTGETVFLYRAPEVGNFNVRALRTCAWNPKIEACSYDLDAMCVERRGRELSTLSRSVVRIEHAPVCADDW